MVSGKRGEFGLQHSNVLSASRFLELEERFCFSLRPPSSAYKSPCLCFHEEVVQNILGGQTYRFTRQNVILMLCCSGFWKARWVWASISIQHSNVLSASRFCCLWTEIYRQFSMFTLRILSGYDNSREWIVLLIQNVPEPSGRGCYQLFGIIFPNIASCQISWPSAAFNSECSHIEQNLFLAQVWKKS